MVNELFIDYFGENDSVKTVYTYREFELQEEEGIFFVCKNCELGGARIGLVIRDEDQVYFYPSEGMAFTDISLTNLSNFLSDVKRRKLV